MVVKNNQDDASAMEMQIFEKRCKLDGTGEYSGVPSHSSPGGNNAAQRAANVVAQVPDVLDSLTGDESLVEDHGSHTSVRLSVSEQDMKIRRIVARELGLVPSIPDAPGQKSEKTATARKKALSRRCVLRHKLFFMWNYLESYVHVVNLLFITVDMFIMILMVHVSGSIISH